MTSISGLHDEQRFTDEQLEHITRFLRDTDWKPMRTAIHYLPRLLERAMAATREDFERWPDLQFKLDVSNELHVEEDEIERLPSDDLRTYIARLIYSIAFLYGLVEGRGEAESPGEIHLWGVAHVLHKINDIAFLP